MRKLRAKLTYSNVMSTLCLFLILGGGAYAASRLPKNSVGRKQIKANAVNGSKVANGSLTKADLRGAVPNASHAANADHATSATNAENANKLDGQDSTEFAQVGSEAWQAPALNAGDCPSCGGGPVAPHTLCYWTNYSDTTNWETVGYFRDRSGVVHLKGLAVAHDGSFPPPPNCGVASDDVTIFILPPGYRPDAGHIYPTISNDDLGRLTVTGEGRVSIEENLPTWDDARTWVALDAVTFRCGPSGQNGCP